MLVLTRRVGDLIRIGDDILIKVVAVKGTKIVRLGIDAPAHLRISREDASDQTKEQETNTIPKPGEPHGQTN